MLAIQAHCHAGHIQIASEGIPLDANVVVLFLPTDASNTALSPDQQVALALQSQSNFAQTILLNPAEDCWNNA